MIFVENRVYTLLGVSIMMVDEETDEFVDIIVIRHRLEMLDELMDNLVDGEENIRLVS